MSLVLDASITLSWYFDDESNIVADKALDSVIATGAIVPSLWILEVGNCLQMGVKRKRITQIQRDNAIMKLSELDIQADSETSTNAWHQSLTLSDRYNLTLYDATYLELAQRRSFALATQDKALMNAAESAGVRVFAS